jgi:hypothetical protein
MAFRGPSILHRRKLLIIESLNYSFDWQQPYLLPQDEDAMFKSGYKYG